MDPQQAEVAKQFDNQAASYRDQVDASIRFSPMKGDFFIRAKAEHLRRLVQAELSEPGSARVLDVGCGVGTFHPHLDGVFASIAGVDVSNEAVALARLANPQVAYEAYDGDRLPFDSDSFDVAFASCVVHHVPVARWDGFVAEMFRVVRPGGLVVIFEHNKRHPLTRKAVHDCPFDEDAVLVPSDRARSLLNTGTRPGCLEYILTIPAATGFPKAIDEFLARARIGTQYCCWNTVAGADHTPRA